jgi:uncharacterized Tic20 family protein
MTDSNLASNQVMGGYMNAVPTSDEKVMAALAHGSIILAFLGPVVPVAIWASQRRKSKYVCFHSLQAMGYQAFMFWLWFALMILIMLFVICLAVPLSITVAEDASNVAAPLLIQFFMFIVIFGMMALFFLTGIVGAVLCLLGRDFRYPLIGTWLERHLPYEANSEAPIDETREDNWVAGVCHATAILQMWGIVTPLIVWFTQKEQSARLRFQSLQAAIYQGAALVVYLAGMVLYMVSFFGMFFVMFAAGAMNAGGEIQGPVGGIFVIFFVIVVILWLVITILAPIYYLLAGIASLRTIRGHPFRYPIIGKMIERRMKAPPKLETTL